MRRQRLTPADIAMWFDVAAKIATFGTTAIAAWNAYRANRNAKTAVQTATDNHAIIKEVVEQVNGRMSQILDKVPDLRYSSENIVGSLEKLDEEQRKREEENLLS